MYLRIARLVTNRFYFTKLHQKRQSSNIELDICLQSIKTVTKQMPTFVCFSLTETLLIDSRSHSDYKFLQNSLDFANGIDDNELWQETEDAANVLGFTDEQRIAMYKTCAGILHWGNGKFKQRPREEQAEVAESECKIMNYRFCSSISL